MEGGNVAPVSVVSLVAKIISNVRVKGNAPADRTTSRRRKKGTRVVYENSKSLAYRPVVLKRYLLVAANY